MPDCLADDRLARSRVRRVLQLVQRLPDGGHIGCYQRTFGHGSTSSDPSPTHDYAAPGTDTVTLTAVDNDGFATATAKQTVTITRLSAVFVP